MIEKNKLPLAEWSEKYNVELVALNSYYDALMMHVRYVQQIGKEFGVPEKLLNVHDQSKFTKYEFPHYADRFHGLKNHNRKFIKALNHHYRNNAHHAQYWIDKDGTMQTMPVVYVWEMVTDWHAASLQYNGNKDISKWLSEHYHRLQLSSVTRETLNEVLKELDYDIPTQRL